MVKYSKGIVQMTAHSNPCPGEKGAAEVVSPQPTPASQTSTFSDDANIRLSDLPENYFDDLLDFDFHREIKQEKICEEEQTAEKIRLPGNKFQVTKDHQSQQILKIHQKSIAPELPDAKDENVPVSDAEKRVKIKINLSKSLTGHPSGQSPENNLKRPRSNSPGGAAIGREKIFKQEKDAEVPQMLLTPHSEKTKQSDKTAVVANKIQDSSCSATPSSQPRKNVNQHKNVSTNNASSIAKTLPKPSRQHPPKPLIQKPLISKPPCLPLPRPSWAYNARPSEQWPAYYHQDVQHNYGFPHYYDQYWPYQPQYPHWEPNYMHQMSQSAWTRQEPPPPGSFQFEIPAAVKKSQASTLKAANNKSTSSSSKNKPATPILTKKQTSPQNDKIIMNAKPQTPSAVNKETALQITDSSKNKSAEKLKSVPERTFKQEKSIFEDQNAPQNVQISEKTFEKGTMTEVHSPLSTCSTATNTDHLDLQVSTLEKSEDIISCSLGVQCNLECLSCEELKKTISILKASNDNVSFALFIQSAKCLANNNIAPNILRDVIYNKFCELFLPGTTYTHTQKSGYAVSNDSTDFFPNSSSPATNNSQTAEN